MDFKIVKTKKDSGEFLKTCGTGTFVSDSATEMQIVNIVPEVEYQTIDGFGGAFTEAASTTLDKLSPNSREKILKAYFDKKDGIGYNFCRTHINSCDFALGNYTYVKEGDKTLATFDIERDRKSLLPMIKDAKKYGSFKLFASPWSPPAYMKTSKKMNEGGKLLPNYFDLWAEYFAKYINEYKKEGVDVFAVTVQNEPKAVQPWDSCIYTAEEERDFVKNHLGKKMRDIGIEIFFWDHNKERVYDRAKVMFSDTDAAAYTSGLAFHWYSGDHFEELEMFNKMYPGKKLIFSEGCREYSLGKIDSWDIGEAYAHDIIGNFNNYCNAFCDWNLLLNEIGGPNHVKNYCDAPIMADTRTDEVILNSSYYYIGQFSKFVEAGAKRIGSSKWTDKIEVCAFKNPNGEIVAVILNRQETDFACKLRIGDNTADIVSEARSIMTVIISDYRPFIS